MSRGSKGAVEMWTPTQADFDGFARLSGDDNPIHVDPAFSARTRFGRTVAHGMLLYTRVWGAIQRAWPGRVHRGQTLMFPNPSFAGETLRIALDETAPGVIAVSLTRPDGAAGLTGECRLAASLSPRSSPRKRGSTVPPEGAERGAWVPASAGTSGELSGGGGLPVGRSAFLERTYLGGDMEAFASLAGVTDPPRTVPEPLIGALFSYLLGVKLPGPGTNYLKQEMEFLAPARWGEALTATVEITRLRPDKDLVDLAAVCSAADGAALCRGRALVLVKDVGKNP